MWSCLSAIEILGWTILGQKCELCRRRRRIYDKRAQVLKYYNVYKFVSKILILKAKTQYILETNCSLVFRHVLLRVQITFFPSELKIIKKISSKSPHAEEEGRQWLLREWVGHHPIGMDFAHLLVNVVNHHKFKLKNYLYSCYQFKPQVGFCQSYSCVFNSTKELTSGEIQIPDWGIVGDEAFEIEV